MVANMPLVEFAHVPDVKFVHADTVQAVHSLLNVSETFGLTFGRFFDLLRSTADEIGIVDAADERVDEVIPYSVLDGFLREFFKGMCAFLGAFDLNLF